MYVNVCEGETVLKDLKSDSLSLSGVSAGQQWTWSVSQFCQGSLALF